MFFTSDTHWEHDNVIKYCNRPFSSVEEMNETLIANWNSVVGPKDLVFHLGDFAFKTQVRADRIKQTISRLNGNIILIKGNHDKTKTLSELGIKFIHHEAYLTVDNKSLWLSHYPLVVHDEREDLKRPKPRQKYDIALHGHRHSTPEERETWNQWGKLIALDVGVDCQGQYRPWAWEEIKELIKA
jgi:calcineurin-like phosphoesterase family protein